MPRIIVFLLVMYLIYRVVKWLLPFLFKRFMGRMTDNMTDFADQFKQNADNRTEGEVIIENKKSDLQEKLNDQDGEYVDFEELD